MSYIKILPASVINKIAAGEVIDRPAAVVKELIENSIDAMASRIDTYLEDGGRKMIRISDDGIGMDAEDLSLAFQSHATSKLLNADDLFVVAGEQAAVGERRMRPHHIPPRHGVVRLEEVRAAVAREWENDRRSASLAESYRKLRAKYEIVIEAKEPSRA